MSIDRGMDKEDVVHIYNVLGFFLLLAFLFFGSATQLAES